MIANTLKNKTGSTIVSKKEEKIHDDNSIEKEIYLK